MPPSTAPRKASSGVVVLAIAAGVFTMAGVGVAAFLVTAAPAPRPRPPPPVAIPERPVPPPAPVVPPVQSAPAAAVPEPEPAPAPTVKKPAPALPRTNEAWGALKLAKKLRQYDFCGSEAILRQQDIPRRYRLRARFDANGEGRGGEVEPAPVAMLNPCIENRTKYIYLGKPPEKRDFEVEITLSFAHLRPKGKPETYDDQWDIDGRH